MFVYTVTNKILNYTIFIKYLPFKFSELFWNLKYKMPKEVL